MPSYRGLDKRAPEGQMGEETEIFCRLFWRRKSIRQFSTRDVEPEKTERLLRALQRAQSAANRQPWHFILLDRGDEKRAGLNEVFTKEGFRDAPLLIVACAEPGVAWTRKTDGVNYAWVDVTIAVSEMIAVATADGLGTCWIAAIDPVRVKKILQIPASIDVVAIIALGYPLEELRVEEKNRKSLKEIIHHGKW